jgi:hypothetical protein
VTLGLRDFPDLPARRLWWPALFLFCVLVVGLTWHDARDAWIARKDLPKVVVQLLIYWSCWAVWPALAGLVVRARRLWRSGRRRSAGLALALWTGCVLLAWARFIEPSLLVVRETPLSSTCGVRVALVSDLHLGTFWREHDLQRLVSKLNTLDVDAVLIAGDLTIEPSRNLKQVLAPLAGLRHPAFSVTGNHDEEHPGPPLTAALRQALAEVKIRSIEGQHVPLGQCELLGLGDLRSGSAATDLSQLRSDASAGPPTRRVVLVHDPDTALHFPRNFATLALAGHTHGGQIDLPWLTSHVLDRATRGHFRQGLYKLKNTRVFVTQGVGMSKLPLRFRVPPTIDLLTL